LADIVATPDTLEAVLLEDMDRHVEEQARMLARGLGYIQRRMVAEAPRDKGDFAASIRPYEDEPGQTWERGGGGGDAGQGEVDAVMSGWTPGHEVGIATDAPYSRKLVFHAGVDKGRVSKRNRGRNRPTGERRTYTRKAPHGWVEKIVDAAAREMEKTEP
jgi:hypothetical protein